MDGTAVQWPPVGKETNGIYRPKISHAAPGIRQHVENAMACHGSRDDDAGGQWPNFQVPMQGRGNHPRRERSKERMTGTAMGIDRAV